MKRVRVLGAALLAAAGWLCGAPVAAQVAVAANAGLLSAYVWRGATYTNNFVIQPDASVTVPMARTSLTFGLWANIEPGRYNSFSDISESGGTKSFDIAEVNWTGELGLPVTKQATVTLGATGYVFPNDEGLDETSNTVELYGKGELALPFNPTLSLYYDVGKVDGAYIEAGISHTMPASKRTSLTFGALTGFSAGQDADLDSDGVPQAESFNFIENGFTHADLWTTAEIETGPLAISPTLHLIITGDAVTKATKVERDPGTGLPRLDRKGAKLWFGVTIGWSR